MKPVHSPDRQPDALAATAPTPEWSLALTPALDELRLVARVRAGVRKSSNWLQLLKFSAVGGSGYVVNLLVFAALIAGGFHYRGAAVGAFLVAVTNNYLLNRVWTFRESRGHVAHQGARFFAIAVSVLAANLVVLSALVAAGVAELPAQAAAVALGMPLNFVGNKLWTFDRRRHRA